MAKAQKPRKSSRKGAPPQTSDAERLAALRWLAMRIEQLCIEIFVTDRDKFDEVEAALRMQVRLLKEIGEPQKTLESDDCPEGYVLCRNGLCAPMCDGFTASDAKRPGRKGGKKR